MASYSTNLKDWGETGTEYPDGYSYTEDVPPVDVYDDFLAHNTIEDIQHLISLTNDRIETDSGAAGGEPASPDSSHLYHDQGNERLEVYDPDKGSWYSHLRRDGDSMSGVLDMNGYKIHDGTGTLTLGGAVNASGTLTYGTNEVATRTWVNSNADVPNADNADYAHNADQLDGNDASAFATSGHGHSASDLSGVSADSVSGAHHSKTTSSDIDHDSTVGGTDSSAHHSRYTDSEARGAIESGAVDGVNFNNIEDVSEMELGIDKSEGLLVDYGSGTYPVLDGDNLIGGNAIGTKGMSGADPNPTIYVNESQINHNNLSNSNDSDAHHSPPSSTQNGGSTVKSPCIPLSHTAGFSQAEELRDITTDRRDRVSIEDNENVVVHARGPTDTWFISAYDEYGLYLYDIDGNEVDRKNPVSISTIGSTKFQFSAKGQVLKMVSDQNGNEIDYIRYEIQHTPKHSHNI